MTWHRPITLIPWTPPRGSASRSPRFWVSLFGLCLLVSSSIYLGSTMLWVFWVAPAFAWHGPAWIAFSGLLTWTIGVFLAFVRIGGPSPHR